MKEKFDYDERVVKRDSAAAESLAEATEVTWNNHPAVNAIAKGRHGLRVVHAEGRHHYLHGAVGDTQEVSVYKHARSAVRRMADDARAAGLEPVAAANVIVWSGDDEDIRTEAEEGIVDESNAQGISMITGENAVHGDRVKRANIGGAMISISPEALELDPGRFAPMGLPISPIALFADGGGTKPDIYERVEELREILEEPAFMQDRGWHRLAEEAAAMTRDDAAKYRALINAEYYWADTRGTSDWSRLRRGVENLPHSSRIHRLFHHEEVGDRLGGWGPFAADIAAVSAGYVPESVLDRMPQAREGDVLVALRSKGGANARCNGLSWRRDAAENILEYAMLNEEVAEWHRTRAGEAFLEFMSRPSTILYPVFMQALDSGIASATFHMSGGAYRDKLAKPLHEAGLHAVLDDLHEPDATDLQMMLFGGLQPTKAYASVPVGNEAFVATSHPRQMIGLAEAFDLEGRVASKPLVRSDNPGVTILQPAYGTEPVEFRNREFLEDAA